MVSRILIITCVLLVNVFILSEGASMLFIAAISSKSMKHYFNGIVEALAERGHQVTMLSPFKPNKEVKNVREVVLQDMDITPWTTNVWVDNGQQSMMDLINMMPKKCSDALEDPKTQELLKEKFDLVFIKTSFCDCFMSVAHKMQVPFISVNSLGPAGHISNRMGLPSFPSMCPSMLMGGASPPWGILDRLKNLFLEVATDLYLDMYYLPWMESECRERGLCDKSMPPFSQQTYNFSLVIVNSVRMLEKPHKPSIPSIVYAGGIHCKPAEPLPPNLESWIAGSGDAGFIFFSLGSIIKPSDIPEHYLQLLIRVLGSLPQKIIWKWDQNNLKDIPSNFFISKWLPQQDILGDPRLRLFISHGGLMSTLEATYHGAPVLGMPVFLDQDFNMQQATKEGAGDLIQWNELTEDLLRSKITQLISNDKVRATVKRRSEMMREYPITPQAEVTYWVEHVLKYGKEYIKTPALDMKWYEIYNADVWAILITLVVLILLILYKLMMFLAIWIYNFFIAKTKLKIN